MSYHFNAIKDREHLIRKMAEVLDEAKMNLVLTGDHFELCGKIEACLIEWEQTNKITEF